MKNNTHYKTELTLNGERLQYLFVSEGNSTIIKVIEYSPITTFGERVVYNLGFGDYDEISKTILDDTDSNNGDMYVVFNTVLFTVPLFFTSKPDCVIYVCGSDSDEEFKERAKNIKLPEKEVKGWLEIYRKCVSSADKGAIMR